MYGVCLTVSVHLAAETACSGSSDSPGMLGAYCTGDKALLLHTVGVSKSSHSFSCRPSGSLGPSPVYITPLHGAILKGRPWARTSAVVLAGASQQVQLQTCQFLASEWQTATTPSMQLLERLHAACGCCQVPTCTSCVWCAVAVPFRVAACTSCK